MIRAPAHPRGVTLIEILVVVGIIGLLMALLLPTLASVQKQSLKTRCKTQLQQIGMAFQMYLNNNGNRFPLAPALPSVNPHQYKTLPQHLQPFLDGGSAIFHCPADDSLFAAEGTSYFYNVGVGEMPVTKTFFYKVLQTPSMVPILWDADNFHGGTVPCNWLFLDGHVDQFLKQAQ